MRTTTGTIKAALGVALVPLLAVIGVALLLVAAPSGRAATDDGQQQLRTALLSEVSWGDANGCVENVATNDFGSLTPSLGASTRGAFDAFPHADASVDGDGEHVWVGCVTSNSTVGVVAQGIHDMEDAQGDVLPLSEVAIGVTNRPGGEEPAGCGITAGQGSGGCTLPHDGATNRVLVEDLEPGTAELHWQYQLNLPAAQPAGDYAGGTVVFTAAATDAVVPTAPESIAAPAISDAGAPDHVLTVTDGAWRGAPTSFAYQWQTCDAHGDDCVDVADADQRTYTPRAADAGRTFRARVTASNDEGSGTATTATTAVLIVSPPASTGLPQIAPTTLHPSVTATATDGDWSGAPTSFARQWLRCDAAGGACAAIAGATASSYTPDTDDLGHALRVRISATGAGGTGTATSVATAVVTVAAPTAGTAPEIGGSAIQGETLSASHGAFGGGAIDTYTYRWQRCDANGNGCVAIAGATDSTYVPTTDDVGARLRVAVTATNAAGSASATSDATTAVRIPAPTAGSPGPQISGSAIEGQALHTTRGTFDGSIDTYTYRWRRCDASGASCADIAGASAALYVVTAADAGKTLRVVVTASNATGSASATSGATAVAILQSKAYADEVLGDGAAGYWPMNDAAGARSAANAAGGASLALTGAGAAFAAEGVLATAISFPGFELPSESASVLGGAPGPTPDGNLAVEAWINTTDDSDADHAIVVLAGASVGLFTSDGRVYAFNWQTMTPMSTGISVSDGRWHQVVLNVQGTSQQIYIDGALRTSRAWGMTTLTGNTVVVGNGDVTDNGQRFNGTIDEVSTYDAMLSPEQIRAHYAAGTGAPQLTTAPTISGLPYVNQPLTVDTGEWVNDPTSYSYQWQHCAANCIPIAGANGPSYTPTAADVGWGLRAVVTATNARGTATANTVTTADIENVPFNVVPPAIDDPSQDAAAGASHGLWSHSPTSYTYQWQLCDALGGSCLPIAGATDDHYTPSAADVGKTLRVTVTAINPAGGTAMTSAASTPISLPRPVNVDLPALTSTTPTAGVALSTDDGTWTNGPTSFAYQWQRCDAAGASCAAIAGATSASYTPTGADAAKTLRAAVTAANAAGPTTVMSAATAAVTSVPPVNTVLPAITGTPVEGGTLTASTGTWTGSGTPTYTYQWQRCDANGNGCVNAAGLTSATYTPVLSDNRRKFTVKVTATTATGSATATSAPSALVTAKTYQNTVLADGPLAFWGLDDTSTTSGQKAADRMGTYGASFVTPTCIATSPTSTTPLIVNAGTDKALGFKAQGGSCATGSYAQMPSTLTLSTTAFTAEVWIKGTNPGADGIHGPTTGAISNIALTGTRFAFITSTGTMQTLTLTTPIAANTTAHLVGTWNGTTMAVYVNGVLRQSMTPSVAPSFFSFVPTVIGVDNTGGTATATTDTVDEAAVYNKVLTATQIQQHYSHAVIPRG